MTDSESEVPIIDLEPKEVYTVGTIVTLKTSLNPDSRHVLTEPVHDSYDGVPQTAGFELDEQNEGLSDAGTIRIEDIKDIVGQMTPDEVNVIYEHVLLDKYPTLPTEEVRRIAAKILVQANQ